MQDSIKPSIFASERSAGLKTRFPGLKSGATHSFKPMRQIFVLMMIVLCCGGVHAYAPSEPQPKLLSKEIPTLWQTINWDYEHLIWCSVDEENKEIRIGVPVGHATVPNQTLTMNYMEGLTGPIHFSQYAGREVAMGAARKWSVDDIAGSLAIRCERQLPANASPFGALRQSQCPDRLLLSRRHRADDRHRHL